MKSFYSKGEKQEFTEKELGEIRNLLSRVNEIIEVK